MNLLVRLAAVCPTDPFDGFFAWIGCSFVKSLGLDPDKMHGDLVSTLLAAPLPAANGSCPTLLESIMGQSCVTQTLWQMTEAAAYPIIIAALGARFGRMLAQGNYQVSPGWAVADPVLRALVAATFVHLSYGLMVEVHVVAETLAVLLFGKITAAGGVTGAALAFPSLGGALLLADIVYWLYSIYIFFLIMASLIGFQICVVLAPLVIPFWVYSGQNHVFSWFTKTVGGALVLPIAVAVGWAIIIDMVHQMAVTSPLQSTGLGGFVGPAAWMLTILVIGCGVWFMGKFVKATTGELFSGHLLSTVFLAESTLLMSSRLGGAVLPDRAKHAMARGALGMNRRLGRLMPAGLVRAGEGYLSQRMGLTMQVANWMGANGPARMVAAAAMPPRVLAEQAIIRANNAWGSLQAGDVVGAGEQLRSLDFPRIEESALDAFLKADPRVQQRVMWTVLSSPTGVGNPDNPRTQALIQRANDRYHAILQPGTPFMEYVEGLRTVASHHVPGVDNSTPPYQTLRNLGVGGPFRQNQFHWDELQRRTGG